MTSLGSLLLDEVPGDLGQRCLSLLCMVTCVHFYGTVTVTGPVPGVWCAFYTDTVRRLQNQ